MKFEKKTISKYVAIGIICFLLGAAYVYAQSSNQIFTISQGLYPGAPTWTIYTDGANTYAKDSYGLLVYAAADAATVINDALETLAGGGKVYFEEGSYSLTATLILDSQNEIELCGTLNSILYQADGSDLAALINVSDSHNFYIHDLYIDCNRAGNSAGD